MPYYTYMLRCADGTFYTGYTTDTVRRTATHNSGKGAKYTASRRPVELVWQKAFTDNMKLCIGKLVLRNGREVRRPDFYHLPADSWNRKWITLIIKSAYENIKNRDLQRRSLFFILLILQ